MILGSYSYSFNGFYHRHKVFGQSGNMNGSIIIHLVCRLSWFHLFTKLVLEVNCDIFLNYLSCRSVHHHHRDPALRTNWAWAVRRREALMTPKMRTPPWTTPWFPRQPPLPRPWLWGTWLRPWTVWPKRWEVKAVAMTTVWFSRPPPRPCLEGIRLRLEQSDPRGGRSKWLSWQ